MNSMEASKSSDFGLYPNRSAIALWCNGNTPDSCQACRQKVQWTFWSQTLELQVQIL